jgi:tetratricopeptide (TPR) repeat protein
VSTARAAFEQALAALATGHVEQAWSSVEPLRDQLERDREVARGWLELLRATPWRSSLQAEVRSALSGFGSDAEIVVCACDALLRAAERTPADEPQPEGSPAYLAAEAAERCLASPAAHGLPAELQAALHAARGNALRLLSRHDEALEALQRAIALAPERGGHFHDLAILHKARHAFREALEAAERACALLGSPKPALWNVALCATALGEGARAVEALRALGHDAKLTPGGMPYVDNLPPLQVRAAAISSGHGQSVVPERAVSFELLWVTPISPCHGVVSSATFREASIDYGDVVLWDAVPVGVAEHEGRRIPRLPLLAVLRRGDERRLRFIALQQRPGEIGELAADMPAGSTLFVHAERVEMLCARCASGEHMKKHEHEPAEQHRIAYGKVVVEGGVELAAFHTALDAAQQRHSGVRLVVPGLYEALGDTAAAGKAHQLWRGLERAR